MKKTFSQGMAELGHSIYSAGGTVTAAGFMGLCASPVLLIQSGVEVAGWTLLGAVAAIGSGWVLMRLGRAIRWAFYVPRMF